MNYPVLTSKWLRGKESAVSGEKKSMVSGQKIYSFRRKKHQWFQGKKLFQERKINGFRRKKSMVSGE